MTALSGIRACMFDAYGTLFDFASAAARCPGIPEDKRAALTTLWRDKQLQYTWLRTLQDRYVDFGQVTAEALDFALDSLDLRDAAISASGLQGLFDAVLSVEAVRVFKTHPKVYAYALQQLGLQAGQVSFQSSNGWDAYAASAFGMRVVWCNRYDQRAEQLPGAPDHVIRNLAELPALLAPIAT